MTPQERKVIELALEALENSVDSVVEDAFNAEQLYGNYPTRQGKVGGLKVLAEQHKQAITAIKEALAQPEQEPVAYCWKSLSTGDLFDFVENKNGDALKEQDEDFPTSNLILLYTTPPQRKPLTSQERDAKRWRFLMENSYDSESVTQFHVWEHSWEPHSQTGEPTEWKQRVRGIALIDFIDRAIEAAHGIKGEA